ncbi:MAG: hypothetical protein J5517_04275 [Eubacterium sp.]|nr:hypothetical protein [Eubacterium sp.]
MNIKKLIKTNIINLIIFGLIMLFRVVSGMLFNDHDAGSSGLATLSTVLSFVFIVLWAAYTVYSNMTVVKEEKLEKKRTITEVKTRLSKAGNRRFFVNERNILVTLLDSLETREKYFYAMDPNSKLRELFDLTEHQMLRNATNVSEYLETFDYISGKDTGYVGTVCADSQKLLDKFNKLVELTVTYDDTSRDYDTREIDDMIDALETMRETGKGALGS